VEAFPTKRETAQVVVKVLLEEIIPRYGIPETLGSDNGPAFISNVLQGLARAVGTNWKLHCEYNPQSSGQVERMNRTLKETLSKLAIETGGDWVALLPYAIFRVRNSPYVHGLTPFEILYGALPPIIVRTLPDQDPSTAPNYLASLKALQEVRREIWPIVHALYETKDTSNPEHGIVPGDWVWVKRHRPCTLEERWKGPYLVILVTPTALKVDGIGPWVHHSHMCQANQQEQKEAREWTVQWHPDNPLKLKLLRAREHAESLGAATDG
jgi:transposase InsO family protein